VQPQPDAEFEAIQADLADTDTCRQVIAGIRAVDILVNNAAILIEKPVNQISDGEFDRTMAINLRAPFVLSVAAVAGMAERGWGRIINVSSTGARTGGISQSCVYSASKAGIVSITKNFARNYGRSGVTVNAVLPGAINTPMARGQFDDDPDLESSVLAASPLCRLGEGSEVAAVIAFLASDDASYINGASLDVNGGWVMT
jgi:NAD(P)-dependent dehydrogenase (short-subunit alcohol dehydrogenase family)